MASLKDALSAQGWLTEIFVPPLPEQPSVESAIAESSSADFAHAVSPIEPPPDPNRVYFAAEDDPEYDPNEDETLADEYF